MAESTSISGAAFAGQVAIVTGGAQGLGEGIARMLAGHGCAVMLFDVAGVKAKALAGAMASEGCRVEWCEVDVSSEESVRNGFESFRGKFERLDIMVNCAGIVGPNAMKAEQVATADFDRTYEGGRGLYYVAITKSRSI